MNDTTESLLRLTQPLDMSRIKRRQAPGNGVVPLPEVELKKKLSEVNVDSR
jgi:hypothetical protein